MKYNIGDTIKIKPYKILYDSLNAGIQSSCGISWNDLAMPKLCGKKYVIIGQWSITSYAIEDETGDTWTIAYEWIEHIEPITLPEELFVL